MLGKPSPGQTGPLFCSHQYLTVILDKFLKFGPQFLICKMVMIRMDFYGDKINQCLRRDLRKLKMLIIVTNSISVTVLLETHGHFFPPFSFCSFYFYFLECPSTFPSILSLISQVFFHLYSISNHKLHTNRTFRNTRDPSSDVIILL